MPALCFQLPDSFSSEVAPLFIIFTIKHATIHSICYSLEPIETTSDYQQKKIDLGFAAVIKFQLEQYFENSRYQFELNCQINLATPFQQRVWQALQEIPSGQHKTYGELAAELNTSARAIGNACRQNLFPLVIPCHRILSKSGLGGYAGDTLDSQKTAINYMAIKKGLLRHEQS